MERQIYSYEEAYEESLRYSQGDELAARVWVNKYAVEGSFENIYEKSPKDIHWRLANEVARIETKYPNALSSEQLFELFDHLKYIVPQGSPMTGIGNDYQVASLSNCFVTGIDGSADSCGAIIKTDEEQVQLVKRRGGVGHDLSHIHPKGSPAENSALASTGLVPFMERYSDSTHEVTQDGCRGVLILNVSIKHPDSEALIDTKMTEGKVTGVSVSVKLDDTFMAAIVEGRKHTQQYPIDSDHPTTVKEIDASNLWKKIVHNAWKSAELGVLFWDTIIRESVPDYYADLGYKTVSTSPCGEIPLCPYDSCRLLTVDLYSYTVNPFTKDAYPNFKLFREHVALARRIMDDIIDLESEKIERIMEKIDLDPENEEVKHTERGLWERIYKKNGQGRCTGVGITAGGDMLVAFGMRYETGEATDFSEKVHKAVALGAYHSSMDMAKERSAFDVYDTEREKSNPFINRLREADPALYGDMKKYGRRNIACLTIAPTGTTSLTTQTTSGIEPVFLPVYKCRREVNPNDTNVRVDFVDKTGDAFEGYIVFHHKFVTWMKANGYDPAKRYTQEEVNELVAKSPYYKATSNDVDWLMRVRMQGKIQKWVDHSTSVTINLPNDVDEEPVNRLYVEAWKSDCKSCTVYHDGSRSEALISAKSDKDKKEELPPCKPPAVVEVRPPVFEADVVRFQNNEEKWVALVGLLDGRFCEIFTGLQDNDEGIIIPKSVNTGRIIKNVDENGNKRYDFQFENKRGYKVTIEGLSERFNKEYWNYAKLVSGTPRWRMSTEQVIKLVGSLQLDSENINTWKNGVEHALKKYVQGGTEAKGKKCPNCGNETSVHQEGCLICTTCGASRCG